MQKALQPDNPVGALSCTILSYVIPHTREKRSKTVPSGIVKIIIDGKVPRVRGIVYTVIPHIPSTFSNSSCYLNQRLFCGRIALHIRINPCTD